MNALTKKTSSFLNIVGSAASTRRGLRRRAGPRHPVAINYYAELLTEKKNGYISPVRQGPCEARRQLLAIYVYNSTSGHSMLIACLAKWRPGETYRSARDNSNTDSILKPNSTALRVSNPRYFRLHASQVFSEATYTGALYRDQIISYYS